MAVDYTASVYWGVPEPKSWITKRVVKSTVTNTVCPNGHGNKSGKFCSICGTPTQDVERTIETQACWRDVYDINGFHLDSIVHCTDSYDDDDALIFGVQVATSDVYGGVQRTIFTEPSGDVKEKVLEFLKTLGIAEQPRFYLVMEAH